MHGQPEKVYNLNLKGDYFFQSKEQGLLVPNASANPHNPNLVVDPATRADLYKATDATNPNYLIRGTLAGGVLEFTVVAKIPGQTGAVSGQDFFAAMMAHFTSGAVKSIEGHWISGIDLDTNIDRFNALTRQGLSDIDAAKRTWTGQRAKDYGFTNVRIYWKDPPGDHPGQYVEVKVSFTR